MRKIYQRKFNQKIHALNKNIEKDPLWKGRFYFMQVGATWWKFDDNSGGELRVQVRAYDKLTGYYKDYFLSYGPWMSTFNWHLTMEVGNTFVVEDLKVWDIEPNPRDKQFDFRGVRPPYEKLRNAEPNYYTSNEYFEQNGFKRI